MKLATRLGGYLGLTCSHCSWMHPGSFNSVDEVKRKFSSHLTSSPACAKVNAIATFQRSGRVVWKPSRP